MSDEQLGGLYAAPGNERVFGHLDSEDDLQARLRQEDRQEQFRSKGQQPSQATRELFPPRRPLTTENYQPRAFAGVTLQVEPSYVCYQRLYYQQINFERYGWNLGAITPVVNALVFYGDVAAFPYKFAKQPLMRAECSAGLCLPGSPTPLLIYPPGLSVSGGLAEAGVAVALFAVFP